MTDLSIIQFALIALIFAWSGFVRSGIGFGGALFTLPFLLLVHNDPLIFLPIISTHLLFFASTTLFNDQYLSRAKQSTRIKTEVNWWFIRYSMAIMIIPKIAGVIGLLVLPVDLVNLIIFSLIGAYALTYIFDKPMRSQSPVMDVIFLVIGAYISGTSLVGGPLIIAVAMRHIESHQFRSTLFVIWFVLVAIKMIGFSLAGVDLQLINALKLLPFAAIGHIIGLRTHQWLLQRDNRSFYRNIGWILLVTSAVGSIQAI
ncbi:MAG: TSUP family transporter [Porticoccaceae bacterium]